jgi:hypothetical protein
LFCQNDVSDLQTNLARYLQQLLRRRKLMHKHRVETTADDSVLDGMIRFPEEQPSEKVDGEPCCNFERMLHARNTSAYGDHAWQEVHIGLFC